MITTGAPTDPRLATVLDRLVRDGILDPRQADEVAAAVVPLLAPHEEAPEGLRGRLAEIAGYVGGAFVVGATFLFVGQQWDSLGQAGRVAVLAAVAVLTAAVGLAVAASADGPMRRLRTPAADPVRRRLASTLLTGSGAAAAFAAGLALYEPTRNDGGPPLVGALVGLAIVLAGYALVPSVVGQLGALAASFVAVFAGVDVATGESFDDFGLASGLLLVGLGAAWIGLLAVGWWREQRVALGCGAGVALFGAQYVYVTANSWEGTDDTRWVGYLLTALVVLASFAGYAKTRGWPLLAVGVIGATALVPEFLLDVTDGSLGSSGVMLVAGLTLLAASALSLRLRREVQEGEVRDDVAAGSPDQAEGNAGPQRDTPA